MRHGIIGTAGHIDHGKTTLIKALTGIDCDRLSEEKKRGITIDIGFSHIKLDRFGEAGIVDVPGHEKYVRNMIAGAFGIDLALLVIDAGEGIMPETKEHIEILDMLKVKCGVIALTKCDLVSPDIISLVSGEIREYTKGSVFENAKIVPVSARTGEGLENLRNALDEALMSVSEDDNDSFTFVPIDRSFSVHGFGTVVTGYVRSGRVLSSEEYEIYPSGRKVSIRGIEVHSEPRKEAKKGERVAVNLKDISKDEIERGFILGQKGALKGTSILDVIIKLQDKSSVKIRNNEEVHLYLHTAEYICKVVLMDKEEILPGESAYAQLRFASPVYALCEDTGIVRTLSPVVTCGSVKIIDNDPVKKRRCREDTIKSFVNKTCGNPEDKLYEKIKEHEYSSLFKINEEDESAEKLIKSGRIVRLDAYRAVTSEYAAKMKSFLIGILDAFHRDNPLLPGMKLATVKEKMLGRGRDKDAGLLIAYYKDNKVVQENGGCISLFDFRVTVPSDDGIIRERLLKEYRDAGINPPAYNDVKESFLGSRRFIPVLKKLIEENKLIRLDDRYLVSEEAFNHAKEKLILMAGHTGGEITLSGYRDRLKSSRKVALAFLEYFDKEKLTEYDGNVRRIVI